MSLGLPTLGRLERVNLRTIWPSESSGFTPWLAQEDNIASLGDAIGIDLEVEAQEKEVGPFRADILCKDTITNSWVLIENQLERTDHSHLGQLLTYAAGLEAVTIVWIAQQFTDEHRAALDWLNEITNGRFNFFGLEIELWRIGSSPVAPKFNVVCKPNDWTQTIARAASQLDSQALSETKRLQLEYWTAFQALRLQRKSHLRASKPRARHWNDFAIGRSGFSLLAFVDSRLKRVGVSLVMSGPLANVYFDLLKREAPAIEGEAGIPLDWHAPEAKRQRRVYLRKADEDPLDRASWERQQEWLVDKLELFHRIFARRIKRLDASAFNEAADGEATI